MQSMLVQNRWKALDSRNPSPRDGGELTTDKSWSFWIDDLFVFFSTLLCCLACGLHDGVRLGVDHDIRPSDHWPIKKLDPV